MAKERIRGAFGNVILGACMEKGWPTNRAASQAVESALEYGQVIDLAQRTTGENNQDLVITVTVRHHNPRGRQSA